MAEDFKGPKVALITGGRRGIGAAIARELLDHGWLVSFGLRGGLKCDDWMSSYPSDQVHAHAYDAADGGGEEAWVEAALKAFGRIDAVVSSAGIVAGKSAMTISEPEMKELMEVNALAPRRLVKAAWAELARCGKGRVIIVASLSGKRVISIRAGSYAMTKFAAVALNHAIRQEGHALGIRSTAICPGYVATDMARGLSDMPPEKMTRPEDVAKLTRTMIDLPNEASVAELTINYGLEPFY